ARGVAIVGPEEGELAEGEVGAGRMAEPEVIAAALGALLDPDAEASHQEDVAGERPPSSLRGLTVVVSAGGTREPLDAVRFLGNRSSGRMGVALAEAAARRGAAVTLLAANVTVRMPAGIEVIETPTAADLRREALARAEADVVLMAAAVADYRPAERIEGKRPKDNAAWTVDLVPTADVVKALGAARRPEQVLVAFGAEAGESGRARKRAMLDTKNVDLVVFNDIATPGIGFESDDNEVVLMSRSGERHVPKTSKRAVAEAVLDEVERLWLARA
ncbi:MAG: phosphopantothenoylcysteine decarboxylase, partial [Gaiella sp.]